MIRVLRVLEYEYPDHAAYEQDSTRWTERRSYSSLDGQTVAMVSEVVRVQEVPS